MQNRTCNRCNRPLVGRQKKYCSHVCANRSTMEAISDSASRRPWATCKAAGCEKKARSRVAELCPMHYHRLYRYGTLERTDALVARGERESPNPPANKPGDRYGTITLTKRVGSQWVCQCDCGQTRIARAGDLNRTGDASTCGHPGRHLAPHVEYGAAHERVRRERGPAKHHRCVDCGLQARHWSYDHADPAQVSSLDARTLGIPYSLDISHYEPRCVPCHKAFDLGFIATSASSV